MALNFLLHRHQVSLMRATSGTSPEARASHRGLAAGYARRIRELSARLGTPFTLGEPNENPDRGMAG